MDLTVLGFPIVDVASTTLLVGVFLAVVTDRLVPGTRMDKALKYREEHIARQDDTITELLNQNRHLLAKADADARVMEALPRVPADGGSDA
ncbi:hypothetical protein [Rhodococcus sp. Chr-9]|uniref:hypothetical protein n=1 Tax=Rhodococcus sp. Chr-9 TaxID=713612 RepID=UPI0005756D86|nr:hypothetical protein [Rhodococcus sp. Chr-9]KHJ74648.1 hypothetical protein QR64_00180 [Rhodococcus sp. Chr-9]